MSPWTQPNTSTNPSQNNGSWAGTPPCSPPAGAGDAPSLSEAGASIPYRWYLEPSARNGSTSKALSHPWCQERWPPSWSGSTAHRKPASTYGLPWPICGSFSYGASLRRRKRTHSPGHLGHAPNPRRRRPAPPLQHVCPDPCGTCPVLPYAGADPEDRHRCHSVDVMVSWLPGTLPSQRTSSAGRMRCQNGTGKSIKEDFSEIYDTNQADQSKREPGIAHP